MQPSVAICVNRRFASLAMPSTTAATPSRANRKVPVPDADAFDPSCVHTSRMRVLCTHACVVCLIFLVVRFSFFVFCVSPRFCIVLLACVSHRSVSLSSLFASCRVCSVKLCEHEVNQLGKAEREIGAIRVSESSREAVGCSISCFSCCHLTCCGG